MKERTYKVILRIFRGADPRPVRVRHMGVESDSALGACSRAEAWMNVALPDNEYAAAHAVWPAAGRTRPAAAMPVALAA